MKRILSIIFWSAMIVMVGSLFIFANVNQEKLACPRFEISVENSGIPALITQGAIRQQLTRNGIAVKGKEIGTIEAEKIQKLLDGNPFLKDAALNIGVNGVVKATVKQRNPILRVIDKTGNQCYIDDEGCLMPLSPEFPARVIIASGDIKPLVKPAIPVKNQNQPSQYRNLPADLACLYVTAKAIRNDAFSNALFEQIFLNSQGEIELCPKIGHQNILLGDTSLIAEKLRNLKLFYTRGMKNTDWNTYQSINLKFRNQVVCTKTK